MAVNELAAMSVCHPVWIHDTICHAMAAAMMRIEPAWQECAQLVQLSPPPAPPPRCQHSPRLPARCYAASRTGCWGSCRTCTQHMRMREAQPWSHTTLLRAVEVLLLQHPACCRIMRRRFLPSSFGLMDLAWGGKKIAQAAFTLRTKSETGPFVLDACADSPPPLTY